MSGRKSFVVKTVRIEREQEKWIKEKEEFNFSGWVRSNLRKLIGKEDIR